MLEHTGSLDARLGQLDIELPKVPIPIANFVPYRRHGDLVFLAGQVCEWNGEVRYAGKVGVDYDIAEAQDAARICALNLVAALRDCCGDAMAGKVTCLRLGGFVNCRPDFEHVPLVINGASNLMLQIFGNGGAHARTAVGVASLPRGAAVEVEAVFAVT